MYTSRLRRFSSNLKRELYYRMDGRTNRRCAMLASRYALSGGFQRIYLYHIRKTAGTSLNHMFFALDSDGSEKTYKNLILSNQHRYIGRNHIFVGWNRKLIEEGHYFYGFSHIPIHDIKLPKNTFTITILRDPIQRLVSHFKMLIEESKKLTPLPWYKFERKFLSDTIEEFATKLPRHHLLNQLYMFSSRLELNEAADNINKCNLWFSTNNFNEGVTQINANLNLHLEPVHIRSSQIKIELSQTQYSFLYDILQPEYKLITKLTKHSEIM